MAENLIAVWLDLECASGNDARPTESEIRVGAKILPYLIAGSDLICSGFGSILKYDNSFNPSLLNGEELEDFLVLQRDFEADGGLTPITEDRASTCAPAPLDALSAVLDDLDLAHPDRRHAAPRVAAASGSNETDELHAPATLAASPRRSSARGVTVVDVIRALATARLPRRGGKPPGPRQAPPLRRLPADLGAGPRRPRPLRRQRSQRLRRPRHRLPLSAPSAARRSRHPRRARPREVLRSRGGLRARPRHAAPSTAPSAPPPSATTAREVVDRRQPGLRHQALPHPRRPPRLPTCSRAIVAGIERSRRRRPRRADAPHRRHLLPRPLRGAPLGLRRRHRPPGQGHRGHPPGRPPAAQQPGALLQRPDHHARPLPPPRRQRRRLRPGRDARAGRRADPRRGDGRPLPRRGRADLRHRDRPLPRRRRARGDRGGVHPGRAA